jgi:hypothetical protein
MSVVSPLRRHCYGQLAMLRVLPSSYTRRSPGECVIHHRSQTFGLLIKVLTRGLDRELVYGNRFLAYNSRPLRRHSPKHIPRSA